MKDVSHEIYGEHRQCERENLKLSDGTCIAPPEEEATIYVIRWNNHIAAIVSEK